MYEKPVSILLNEARGKPLSLPLIFFGKIEFKSYGKTKPCNTLQIRQGTTQDNSEVQAVHHGETPLAVR